MSGSQGEHSYFYLHGTDINGKQLLLPKINSGGGETIKSMITVIQVGETLNPDQDENALLDGRKVAICDGIRQVGRPNVGGNGTSRRYSPGYEIYTRYTIQNKLYPTIQYEFHFGFPIGPPTT